MIKYHHSLSKVVGIYRKTCFNKFSTASSSTPSQHLVSQYAPNFSKKLNNNGTPGDSSRSGYVFKMHYWQRKQSSYYLSSRIASTFWGPNIILSRFKAGVPWKICWKRNKNRLHLHYANTKLKNHLIIRTLVVGLELNQELKP